MDHEGLGSEERMEEVRKSRLEDEGQNLHGILYGSNVRSGSSPNESLRISGRSIQGGYGISRQSSLSIELECG
jgi:hypothetical protein